MRLLEGTIFDRPPQCPVCDRLESECVCPPSSEVPTSWLPTEKQTARLAIEKRGKGKVVTLVRGLKGTESDLPSLLGKLKSGCGAGGTVKDDEIEIQGRQLERVRELLVGLGYKVKG